MACASQRVSSLIGDFGFGTSVYVQLDIREAEEKFIWG